MKKIIVIIAVFMFGSGSIVWSSEGDQLPQSTLEGQTLSSQLSTSTDDPADPVLPAPSSRGNQALTDSSDDLSHQGISPAPQQKGVLDSLNLLNIFTRRPSAASPAVPLEELSAQKKPQTASIPSAKATADDMKASSDSADELSHLTLTGDVQSKGMFGALKASEQTSADTAPTLFTPSPALVQQGSQSGVASPVSNRINTQQTSSDDISHQSLSTDLQGQGYLGLFAAHGPSGEVNLSPGTPAATNQVTTGNTAGSSTGLLAMAETDDISHQALATTMQEKELFYYVKTAGAVPLYDSAFRDFLDYGASVSFGVGKKLNENLSLTVAFDMVMLTGDWSQSGDRESLFYAEERGVVNNINEPGQTVISAEEEAQLQSEDNLGTYVRGEAEAQIINAESLKKIDIHTDLYLFPVSINALYKLKKVGKISPYIGGGLGYCYAVRDSDSKTLKSKYYYGPDYKLTFNNNQTSRGMLLSLLGGFNIPVYKNMMFVAEANTTLYDLKKFDPILEVSFTKPSTPFTGTDVSSWSYEDPKQFGVFSQSIVGNFSIGIVMPF